MLSLWLGYPRGLSEQTQRKLARHAANEYEGWVKIVKPFILSHKPMGLASIERVQYDKQQLYFTLLY